MTPKAQAALNALKTMAAFAAQELAQEMGEDEARVVLSQILDGLRAEFGVGDQGNDPRVVRAVRRAYEVAAKRRRSDGDFLTIYQLLAPIVEEDAR